MELRVLQYFLIVAREENITRAAQLLHVTQPTLSRQIAQLEEELGVKLFHRSNHHIVLTDDGMLLRRRAQEIVDLAEKTRRDFTDRTNVLSGEISVGSGETQNMSFLSEQMVSFRTAHPSVRFSVHSATADEIKERIEKGLLDLGLLTEPVDIGKYEFLRLPQRDRWGVLVRQGDKLQARKHVTPADLLSVPLLMPWREVVRNELAGWFGDLYDHLEIAATYNLVVNAATMVRSGLGVALAFDLSTVFEDLSFVPLSPEMTSGAVLVWKKNQTLSPLVSAYLEHLKYGFRMSHDNI